MTQIKKLLCKFSNCVRIVLPTIYLHLVKFMYLLRDLHFGPSNTYLHGISQGECRQFTIMNP
jgi:hypothetical protein